MHYVLKIRITSSITYARFSVALGIQGIQGIHDVLDILDASDDHGAKDIHSVHKSYFELGSRDSLVDGMVVDTSDILVVRKA